MPATGMHFAFPAEKEEVSAGKAKYHGKEERTVADLIEVRGLTKFFPGIKALENVQITIRSGEVHALIGENGAGKSTLVKCLTGVYTPTSGTITVEGKEVSFHNAIDAQKAGICAIHQEASMFPELSVTENIYMGHHLKGRGNLIDWKAMRKETAELLKRMQLDINPDSLVKNLSIAQRHMVEIAKALSLNAKCVIMDEPTSALSNREVDDLYRIIRALKKEGKAIMFISHKLEEIFEICDYFTVLRDGQYIGEGYLKDYNSAQIIHMMIGRELSTLYPQLPPYHPDAPVVLSVRNLQQYGAFQHVSFDLHQGEILGLFGLVGAGRSEIVRTIFGVDHKDDGEMTVFGKPFSPKSPDDAMKQGIALVPEDRGKQGLVLAMSIAKNITMPELDKLSHRGFLDTKREKTYAVKHGTTMEIKAAGWNVDADTLSGGNQQKVVLAKWLGTDPKILILDEPTKGIDVATKAAVHEFIAKMAANGKAIIMISSELPEVMGMSNRILAIHEGNVMGEFDATKATSDQIMRAALGEEVKEK
jgi:rhamnose transport system ATP-binding protein